MKYPLTYFPYKKNHPTTFVQFCFFCFFSRRLWDPSIKFWGYRDRPRPRAEHLTHILPLLVAYTGHEDWRKQRTGFWKKFLNDKVRILV